MKSTPFAIAAAALFSASAALAQNPADVPKHKCEPKPEYPGRLALQVDSTRRNFERTQKNYDACMKAYLADRNAAIEANKNAANAAIEEYNTLATSIRKAIDADKQD